MLEALLGKLTGNNLEIRQHIVVYDMIKSVILYNSSTLICSVLSDCRNEYQHGNLLERQKNILLVTSSNVPRSADEDEEKDVVNDDPQLLVY